MIPGPTARLRASGADTFLIVATPTETITALVTAYRLGWRPNKLVNSVGATDRSCAAARASAGSADAVNGIVTTTYLKDVAAPAYQNDPQVRFFKRLMEKYAPGQPTNEGSVLLRHGEGGHVRPGSVSRGQEPDAGLADERRGEPEDPQPVAAQGLQDR